MKDRLEAVRQGVRVTTAFAYPDGRTLKIWTVVDADEMATVPPVELVKRYALPAWAYVQNEHGKAQG